jgi:hypothetical protein
MVHRHNARWRLQPGLGHRPGAAGRVWKSNRRGIALSGP